MGTRFSQPALRVMALLSLLAALSAPVGAAHADAVVVTNCTGKGLGDAMNNLNNHDISFNCGANPVVITLLQAGGYNAVSGSYYTIDGGNKVTLTGASTNRLFDVMPNAALTLTNITLENGAALVGGDVPDTGGAILAEGNLLALDNVHIHDSESSLAGGAIGVVAGTVTVRNSLIEHNQASHGGGIDSQVGLTLINSTVRQNGANDTSGGGLNVSGQVTISNSQILSNTAQGNSLNTGGGGLAIGAAGLVDISGSQIDANSTPTTTFGVGGGILNLGVLAVSQSSLNGNVAGDGGGLWMGASGGANLVDLMVSGNAATGGAGIENSLGSLEMTHVTFSGNQAIDGGGLNNSGTVNASGITFAGNSAVLNGGGLYAYLSGIATLSDSAWAGNMADQGGGVYVNSGSAVALFNTSLSGNLARQGAGIYINQGAADLRNATRLSANAASTNGGGIYNFQGDVSLTNVSVQANTAAMDGGGLFNDGGTANLTDVTLSRNAAAFIGGGLFNSGVSTATLRNDTFSGNTGLAAGGLANYGSAALTNVTLSGNRAQGGGGGIENRNLLTLWNVTLSNNSAATGGALYMLVGHTTLLTNTVLAYSPAGGNCFGAVTDAKNSLASDNTCDLGSFVNHHNHDGLDPLLTGLGNYGGLTPVHMLKLGSPAIGGVVGSDAPATDQRGLARPSLDGNYDIGAVERQPGDSSLAPRLYLPQVGR